MANKPELKRAVAGSKIKANDYNYNFEQLNNYIENGIADNAIANYEPDREYKKGQWVLAEVDGSFGLYESLVDGNKGNSLTDSNYWAQAGGGAGLEIGDIGIAPLGIDESLGKRRYLNGSVIVQDQYQVFTERVKAAIQTYAGLGCTEEEWQNISAKSVGGQCGKFVVDDEAGTIRLPKIIMPIQGLTDLTKLGEIVEAGLPNIEGNPSGLFTTAGYGVTEPTGAFSGNGTTGNGNVTASVASRLALFDASKSNPTYGNSDTVQQEQIQYPYFIQVATGASVQENITNEIELNIPFVLLEGHYFAAPVYNSSWLQSNAGFTGSLALHPTAYNALLVEQNPNVLVGTTVDNYTKRGLSVKLNTEAYTDYDFVLNKTSQVFRCPLKLRKASGRAVVGNGMTFGLTDGTTNSGLTYANDVGLSTRTSLYGSNPGTKPATGNSGYSTTMGLGITTDPTKSGIETSDEGLYLYFYVGETVQNANLVNVGRVEEKISDILANPHITETYQNGSSWYRVWSPDSTGKRWCEQGGILSGGSWAERTINFLKEYIDTNYIVTRCYTEATSNSGLTVAEGGLSSKNKASCKLYTQWNSNVMWYACGYIA